MADVHVLESREQPGVLQVTLNRPQVHNAIDMAMIGNMAEAFHRAATDHSIRVVVVRATGTTFCAGADLAWMKQAAAAGPETNRKEAAQMGAMFQILATLPKPTIALVQGNAFGGGVGMVAACDVAIAVRSARFALTEVKLGIAPAVISPHVVAAIGQRAARRYMLTAESFGADEAHRLGLVHELVASVSELEGAGHDMAARVLNNAPAAMAKTKALIRAVSGRPLDDALVAETVALIAEMRAAPEGREGVTAFLEKRQPNWIRG